MWVTAEPKPEEISHVDSPAQESLQDLGIENCSEYKAEGF